MGKRGRPRKSGLDYFPHETHASTDEKIDALRAHFGNDGYAFFFIMCERIYQTENAELNVSSPVIQASLARAVMVSVDRFKEMLSFALEIDLFSAADFQRGVLTSNGIKKRVENVQSTREVWRKAKEKKRNRIIPEEKPIIPRLFHSKELKDLDLKDQDQNIKPPTHYNAPVREEDNPNPNTVPKPFTIEGKLDVLKAMQHYAVKARGFLRYEQIQSYQGLIDDDLLLAAIKESGGRTDAYCVQVLLAWYQKGWRKLTDHPNYQEGGESREISRGRIERQRALPRNTAAGSGFEEAGRRSRPGRQVYAPRE